LAHSFLNESVTPSFSTKVCNKVDVRWLESPHRTEAEVYTEVLSWNGFGPYAASTVLQLMGFYSRIPSDTETVRHLFEFHGINTAGSPSKGESRGGNGSPNKAKLETALEKLYGNFGDNRFLAYWTEIWGAYVAKVGVEHMAELGHDHYDSFTASKMAKMG